MQKIGVNEFILKERELKQLQLKKKRRIALGLIMVTGLFIMNWNSMFASQSDMKTSADAMSKYIIAEAQLQGEKADFKEICKQAKKLDETGLRIALEEDGFKTTVYYFKDLEPSPLQVAVLEIPSER